MIGSHVWFPHAPRHAPPCCAPTDTTDYSRRCLLYLFAISARIKAFKMFISKYWLLQKVIKRQAGRHEILALWIKVAIHLFKPSRCFRKIDHFLKQSMFWNKHFECFDSCRNCKPTQKASSTVVSIAAHYGGACAGAHAESTHVPRSYSQSDKMQVFWRECFGCRRAHNRARDFMGTPINFPEKGDTLWLLDRFFSPKSKFFMPKLL